MVNGSQNEVALQVLHLFSSYGEMTPLEDELLAEESVRCPRLAFESSIYRNLSLLQSWWLLNTDENSFDLPHTNCRLKGEAVFMALVCTTVWGDGGRMGL